MDFDETEALRANEAIITCRDSSDGFCTERAVRSLHVPPPKMSQSSPPKKCREASTTVAVNQGGFDEVVSKVPWTLDPSELKKKGQKVEGKCRSLKKKGQSPIT